MSEEKCFICKSKASVSFSIDNLSRQVNCERCTKFHISRIALDEILDRLNSLSSQQIANLSYWINQNDDPVIDENNIAYLLNMPTPTVGEKARRFLMYISTQRSTPGEYIKNIHVDDPKYLALTGCYDKTELGYIIRDYLVDNRHYLINYNESGNLYSFKISPEGWAYIESLKDVNPESRIGFIAMWFDSSMDEASAVIHKAIQDAGYEPLRIDSKQHNNNINDEIIATIRQSKFVVADFTDQRGGVYFEAGFAKGLGLEVIWLCEESDFSNVHFDTNHNNFIIWNRTDYHTLKKKLTDRIIATLGKGSLEQ